MEAKELRIGNLIKTWTGTNDEFDVTTVFSIDEDSINGFKRYLRDAEPIPLTEEWFERFDFEYNGRYYFKGWIEAFFGDKGVVYVDLHFDSMVTGYYMVETDNKYVHQLQNLVYYLSGEELILKQ